MRFNFSKVQLIDIEGKVIVGANLHKTIANLIYHHTKTLDLVEVAMAINKGESVELDKSEVNEIQQLIKDPQHGVFSYARKAILDFIESVQEREKKKTEKSSSGKGK